MFRVIVAIKELVLEIMGDYYEALYKRCYDKAEKHRKKYLMYESKSAKAEKKLTNIMSKLEEVEGL